MNLYEMQLMYKFISTKSGTSAGGFFSVIHQTTGIFRLCMAICIITIYLLIVNNFALKNNFGLKIVHFFLFRMPTQKLITNFQPTSNLTQSIYEWNLF